MSLSLVITFYYNTDVVSLYAEFLRPVDTTHTDERNINIKYSIKIVLLKNTTVSKSRYNIQRLDTKINRFHTPSKVKCYG